MNANTNTAASFTLDTLSINGQTFPAQYSVTPTGTVYAFVTVEENGQPVNLRVKIEPSEAAYAAALAAAQQRTQGVRQPEPAPAAKPKAQRKPKAPKAATIPASEPAQEPAPAAQPEPAQEPAPVAQAEPTQDPAPAAAEPAAEAQPATVQAAPAAQPAPAAPDKPFTGTQLTGTGWRILFDQEHNRTRVILDQGTAPAAAREAVEQAGFYWSAVLGSWNKKLTHKAHRAAQALALQLQALSA